ncbi:MAG: peptidylprolyl isomerase [Rhodobacteraceae bacterium]|nr:peptidylprolyl isomerase [Paracoccaceae bacterium]
MKYWVIALVAGWAAFSSASWAQSSNPYSVAVQVNDRVITNFEIDQRILLLRAFGSSGDLQSLAQKQLIDERLRAQAADDLGLILTEDEIQSGIDEFASRGNLSGDQLLAYIKARGAAPESMRDFVSVGLLWRGVVQSRFAAKANVSDAELDTALNLSTGQVQESVLVSEIQMPLGERGDVRTLELAKKLSNTLKSEAAFSAAARRYSRAPSRGRGGRLDWIPVANLPPQLAGQIMALQPGEVTAPITLAQTVGLFQLRGIRQEKGTGETEISISYTQVPIPVSGEASRQVGEAVDLISDVDTCADLRAESERFGDAAFTDHSADVAAIPANTALALAKLDQNEAGYFQAANGSLAVVMVCDRIRELPEGARENIRNALFNRRIGSFGAGYLQELHGDAVITIR